MSFSDIKGSERLIERLRQMIISGNIFHGYIFEGERKNAQLLADSFVRAALCEKHDGDVCGECLSCRKINDGNSENVVNFGSEGSIKDKDIEALISRSIRKSFTEERVFIVIKNADTMTLRAQNRLLKTLEEPPSGVTLILVAENSESLVQTIRSRCQLIKLFSEGMAVRTVQLDEDAGFRERAVSASGKILRGRPFYELWQDLEYFTSSKRNAEAFVSIAQTFFRDVLIYNCNRNDTLIINSESTAIIADCALRFTPDVLASVIESAAAAEKDLARNVSAGHALKYMIFDIQGKLSDEVS